MSNSQPRRANALFGKRVKERRPTGVSRKRKKQFTFEPLEDRRVMSAQSPYPILTSGYFGNDSGTMQSVSSNTEAGAAELLARELYWQSLVAAATAQTSAASMAAAVTNSVPTDPMLPQQWHLANTGQQVGNPDWQVIYGVPGEDINLAPVWNMGYTGRGVTVAVIDSGTELNHPDLAANINRDLARDLINPQGTGDPDFINHQAHGTAVAGLIGAVANNGIGGVGVAPGVSLVPMRLIDTGQTPEAFITAFRHAIQEIDVTNNSWGPGLSRALLGPDAQQLLAIRDSIFFGRGGLGVIHVFSSGNNAGSPFNQSPGFEPVGNWDSSAYNGWINSRYTIAVTAVDHDGFYNNVDGSHTGYPEVGANVLVAAPTGSNAAQNLANDTGLGSGIFTTDISGGQYGYNLAPDPITGEEFDRDFLDNPDYTSRFNGTSAAAPIATGVVALVLEANPDLTWRDVQEILVRSARQNAPLGVPANGFEQGHVIDGTQNTWIVNQMPVFHDPDPYFGNVPVPAAVRLNNPILDPNVTTSLNMEDPTHPGPGLTVMHYAPSPIAMTNGAGYTVSTGRGTNGEMIGYAHGVVDAEMAVKLAQQWHTKNQALPSELTFSSFINIGGEEYNGGTIPAREIGNQATGFVMVPGGLGGSSGFISYWNEFTAPDPFGAPQGPENTRGAPLYFSVPDSQTMSIESVEVKVSISGGTGEALDHLRILLVSPDGTHSELNNFFVNGAPNYSLMNETPFTYDDEPGSIDLDGGPMVWTFNSKRNWGERSDDSLVFNSVTGMPFVDANGLTGTDGTFPPGSMPSTVGQALQQGWQLHFENYGTTNLTLNGVEMVWHGSPIAAESHRVQGFVGVDDNRDDLFNYSRVIQSVTNLPGDDPAVIRFGEVTAVVDQNQESFAGNVTVTVRRESDNTIVDQFVTGHDGNFYFDLVPDNYIVSIDDPLGRVAQQDAITPQGQLRKYQSEWRITPEHFQVWSKLNGQPDATPVDANGVPIPWLDGNGQTQEYGIKGLNFLLDPGEPPAQEAVFTGTVYADTNGDGQFNGSDVVLAGMSVFADVNRNGQRDAGEITVTTDASGNYNLVVPVTAATVMNVGIVKPPQWTISDPDSQVFSRFVTPGDSFGDLDFYLDPPANNSIGGAQGGILLGVVFQDVNGDGTRQSSDLGAPNFTVYIDNNNNGILDAGDRSTTTNQFGAYAFTNVSPGTKVVRVVTPAPFSQTAPANNAARTVALAGSSTISSIVFGIKDTAVLDYGDGPTSYDTRSNGAYDPARHRKGVYYLGQRIDGELTANHSADSTGDNNHNLGDEDGILFDPIVAGATARIVVTASRNNGYLKGWADWNNDGDFNDAGERLVFTGSGSPTDNKLLSTGANQLFFNVPAGVNVGNVFMRFRYGEFQTPGTNAINTPYGEALSGEVEDYRLTVAPASGALVSGIPADFNQDGRVDGADFMVLQRNFGRTTNVSQANGDANGDGVVNAADVNLWKYQNGTVAQTSTSTGALTAAPLESDEPIDLGTSGSFVAAFADSSLGRLSDAARRGSLADLAARVATAADRLDGSRLEKAAERIRTASRRAESRLGEAGDVASDVLTRVADRLDGIASELSQKDQAIDDLFGSRRRPGYRPGTEAQLADGAMDADEAFAALAE